jgi:phosphotransferase system enzyme I (PtsP)
MVCQSNNILQQESGGPLCLNNSENIIEKSSLCFVFKTCPLSDRTKWLTWKTCNENIKIRDILLGHFAQLFKAQQQLPIGIKLGVMVEVPSLLWQLDEILERVDFLSVGSNDLVQYLFAADRDNKRVSNRFDPLCAPVLRALKSITDKAACTHTPVTLCGEIGGRPLEAMALIGIGYRGLSMTPSSIGPVKAMVMAIHEGELRALMAELLARRDGAASIREELRAYAEAKGVPL